MTFTYTLKGTLTLSGDSKTDCDSRAAEEIETINEFASAQIEIVSEQEEQE